MNDFEFVKKVDQYLSKKFALGDKEKGWDCLNILADFFESFGIQFPKSFKDWDENNYAQKWKQKQDFTVLKEFLLTLGESVNYNFIQPGDIVILEKNGFVSAGLFLGNGMMQVVSNPHGVLRVPVRFFESAIIDIRRLIK